MWSLLRRNRYYCIWKEKVSYDITSVPIKIYKGTMLPSRTENGMEFSDPKELIWENNIFVFGGEKNSDRYRNGGMDIRL